VCEGGRDNEFGGHIGSYTESRTEFTLYYTSLYSHGVILVPPIASAPIFPLACVRIDMCTRGVKRLTKRMIRCNVVYGGLTVGYGVDTMAN